MSFSAQRQPRSTTKLGEVDLDTTRTTDQARATTKPTIHWLPYFSFQSSVLCQVNTFEMTEKEESLSEAYAKAVALVSSNPTQAVAALTQLQETIARASIFSSNETLEDLSTSSIPLLVLEHHLAMALTQVPMSPTGIVGRHEHLQRALDLWCVFYRTMERLEMLSAAQAKDFQILEDLSANDNNISETARMAPATTNRDAKIARFQAKKQVQQEQERLKAMTERRNRLGISENETLDGYDDESLQREIALKGLEIYTQDAIEEWTGVIRELPMIARMVQQQQEMQGDDRYRNGQDADTRRRPDPASTPPLQLTHITKDASTGQIQIRRDTARNQVFRRGWNQPTMTIEELAEREIADAMAREERQQMAQAQQQEAPRRYEQLVKDGMEDRADLVDASADLDRKWDDWKDENPRGSGNKRGDVGDRNF